MGESRIQGCLISLSNGLECQNIPFGCWLFPKSGHLFWSTALSGSTCHFLWSWYAYYYCPCLWIFPTMSVKSRILIEICIYSYSSLPPLLLLLALTLLIFLILPLLQAPFPAFSSSMKNKEDAEVITWMKCFTLRYLLAIDIQFWNLRGYLGWYSRLPIKIITRSYSSVYTLEKRMMIG